jgi:NAD(P)-dependent dehydrogenase (short-subunit alcohol dehydrogenase family)
VELTQPVAGAPLLRPESVVVVTGGARGITAVLAEALLCRFACTIVLVGRVDPDSVPLEIQSLDDAGFEGFEAEFYRRELALNPASRMPELKQRYAGYRSAREAAATLRNDGSTPREGPVPPGRRHRRIRRGRSDPAGGVVMGPP